jgi:leucyl-tRNA synthetase
VRTLPEEMIRALTPFAPLFSKRLWRDVQVLVTGASASSWMQNR